MSENKTKKKAKRMRLPNGFGSIYELPGNRRNPWIARKTIAIDDDGKQQYYVVGYYPTYTKAMAALTEYNKNPIGMDRDITLGGIYTRWSDSRYPKLGREAKKSYTGAWNHLSVIENVMVREIKTSHLQDVVDAVSAKGLSRSTCHKIKVLAGLLCKHAMADDIISRNYAESIELPREEKKEQEYFSDIEIKAINKAAKTNEWAKAIMIMIYTGFRIEEFVSLTKFSVDSENWVIIGGGKTEAGRNRQVPIHPKIQGYVQYWRNKPGSHLITRDNRKINQKYFREKFFRPTLEEIGVRALNPHSTRHTFATLLSRASANQKAVQDLMGHEDFVTTANIYTHTDLSVLREAINSI